MATFQELISKRLDNPKVGLSKTESQVRDKEGRIFREYMNEKGEIVTEEIGQKEFVPIESAPDPELSEILENFLYLGSQDAAVNFDDIEKKNVKFILNVATGIPNRAPELLTYKNVEILDLEETPITQYFPECFEFLEMAREKKQGVLVHCNAGVSRSATVVIAFLMKDKNWSFEQAFKFTKEKRLKINPNPGFVSILKNYKPNENKN